MRQHHLGLVAIFVALTGTAVALPGTNKVDSGDIKPKAVKNSDLADNSVTSPKVANGSLLSEDFASGQLPAGPQGPEGPQGPAGASGSPDSGADILTKLAPVDGSGSGLDADLFDGLNAGAFALAGHNHDATYVNEGQSNSVNAGMIVNPTRAISIPLLSFYECRASVPGELLDFSDTVIGNAQPDFGTGDRAPFLIRWDVTAAGAGSPSDEDTEVCSSITVPPDYASNGIVRIRARNPVPGTAPVEQVGCGVTIDASTAGAFSYTDDIDGTLASGDCVMPALSPDQAVVIAIAGGSSTGVMNDVVDVYGVEFVYTATQ